jgi:hypothetical protein
MTQIRTAEEMIEHKMDVYESNYLTETDIREIMIEYAKQFIDLAAEEANVIVEFHKYKVAKQSILKIKDLIK